MDRLIECVANVSEGRNSDVVNALVACLKSVPGLFLLDHTMDRDHHRSVFSFAGEPRSIEAGAFLLTQTAMALIDLQRHTGEHPRVGSTDVIPFVPIRGVTMDDCVDLAQRLGTRIGKELKIPVFLYERAASNPQRVNLEDIRRGGLSGLRARMRTDPSWLPDFGPSDLHPSAGAVVIGARPPLIAYNVNLDSRDLSVAKDIAKTIRTSNGGLPHVKAIGVALASRGLVQVSMNLTDFDTTSICTAFHAVKREADRHGVKVCQSEIIGLVPQRALLRPVESALKLEGFVPSQILEIRLEMIAEDLAKRQFVQQDDGMDVGHSDRDVWSSALSGFLDAVQAGTPTPGGGSVTALAAALAAALGLMACHIEAGREGIQNVSVTSGEGGNDHLCMEEIQARLRDLEQRLRLLIEADAEAYSGLLQAYGMPKDAPLRMESIATSLRRATAIPVEVASYAWDIAVLLNALRQQTNSPLSADLKVGILMAVAAMEGGLGNAVENLKVIKNPEDVSVFSANIADLKQRLVLVKSL